MKYTIVDSTGELIKVLSSSADQLAGNIAEGRSSIEGEPPSWNCYRANNEWVDKGAAPSTFCTWDATAKAWVDPRAIDQVKADAWAIVKAGRDATIYGTFAWGGSVFDADADSQQRIQGAVQLAILAKSALQSYSVGWTLHDNTTRTLSGDDMVAVGQALGAFVEANFAQGVTLRAQIDAATTATQAQAVAWAAAS